MDQERWRRVEELFHAALERQPEARQAFLDAACGGDTDLRRQVELLLAKGEEAGSFLETPAMRDMTATQTATGATLDKARRQGSLASDARPDLRLLRGSQQRAGC